jgi:sec-independent protein translocase protein TatB
VNFLNNVGPWELMVIVILAILLVGPKRVLQIIQSIRQFAGQIRKMSGEFTSMLQTEVQEAQEVDREVRGVGRETSQDLRSTLKEVLNPFAAVQGELQAAAQETRQALENIAKDSLGPVSGTRAPAQATGPAAGTAQDDAGPAIGGVQTALKSASAGKPASEEKAR